MTYLLDQLITKVFVEQPSYIGSVKDGYILSHDVPLPQQVGEVQGHGLLLLAHLVLPLLQHCRC